MNRFVVAATVLPLSGPAFAQAAADAPIDTSIMSSPGQLDLGSSGSTVPSASPSSAGTVANPGQLDLGRPVSGGGGGSSGGAGISSNNTGVPTTDDEYTHPIYGGGTR